MSEARHPAVAPSCMLSLLAVSALIGTHVRRGYLFPFILTSAGRCGACILSIRQSATSSADGMTSMGARSLGGAEDGMGSMGGMKTDTLQYLTLIAAAPFRGRAYVHMQRGTPRGTGNRKRRGFLPHRCSSDDQGSIQRILLPSQRNRKASHAGFSRPERASDWSGPPDHDPAAGCRRVYR